MKITKNQLKKIEQAWKYCNSSNEPFKAIALYRQLQVEFFETNTEKYIDVLIEEAKAWKICVTFNYLTENEGIETFNALVKLCEDTLFKFKTDFKPHQLFEIGHMQISFAKNYKDGMQKLEQFKNTEQLEESRKLEIEGFMGYAMFMLGQKEQGVQVLKQALQNFEKLNLEKAKFKDINVDLIKYTGALLKLATILDDKTEAKILAKKALVISKQHKLRSRQEQAQKLINANK